MDESLEAWVNVSYFVVRGGAGSTRMKLGELPEWIHRAAVSDNPFLVRDIEVIARPRKVQGNS